MPYGRVNKTKEESIKLVDDNREKLGFKDSRYFSSIFKKYIGITPTEYKENTN